MILFRDDWKKYPKAQIHYSTKNKSYLRLAGLYKSMGIRNNAFMLAIHNPLLLDIDPLDTKNLTPEQIIMIVKECKENPWYFFREIVTLIASGSPDPVHLRSNRANISLWWLFFNHITVMLIQPRQTGKSLSTDALMTYVKNVAGLNNNILLFTKDDNLRVTNVKRLKDIENNLPSYLKLKTREDANNTEKLTCVALGNTYSTAVGQASVQAARNIGRGFTVDTVHVDELPFISNVEISLPAMLAATGAARDNVKRAGGLYGNIFTTTAGFRTTKSGRFGYKIYTECFRWTEKLLDCENIEELEDTIKRNSTQGKLQVLCEFNHRQLGFTDNWLRTKIQEALSEGENAEADYLNIWGTGSSSCPIPKDILNRMENASKSIEPIIRTYKHKFITRWYVPYTEIDDGLQDRTLVMGMDTSDAVGRDEISMYIMDVVTGECVGTGCYNETNIVYFCEFLADFLIEFSTITLIIERRSTGTTIIDFLINIFLAKGIDPFKRMFNWVVNDSIKGDNYYKEVTGVRFQNRDRRVYEAYRSKFGFGTSGGGRTARSNLYGAAFSTMIKYLPDVMYDKTFVGQMSNLEERNGRIDHPVGEHDDLCISGLLCVWFLTRAKNHDYYGIDVSRILSNIKEVIIEEEGGLENILEKKRQQAIKEEIYKLSEEIKETDNILIKERLTNKLKHIYTALGENVDPSFNIDDLLQQLKNNR